MKYAKYLFLFIAFMPLFIFRDFTPNNELKYLSIADEAIRDGHLFTFWNHGTVYADKPPLYLWIVMLGKIMLGSHSMLFLGLFSILPAFVILYVMDNWVSPMINRETRLSGQLMLLTSGLFCGSAIVLRMDMMMCMFIVLSLYTFYKLYLRQDTKSDTYLLPLYIFFAIFSKGPVGLVVPLLSIATFLLIKRQIRLFWQFLGWRQWSVLLGLCAVWFGAVYAEGGNTYLNNLLFNQTINRAVDSFHHKEPVYYYFISIWYSLAPWILLYAVTIFIAIKERVLKTDLEVFFITIIATTFIALSLFSGKLNIYMLPLFPFFAYLAIVLLPKINITQIRFTIVIPAIVLALAFPGLYVASYFADFAFLHILPLHIATFALSAFAGLSLYFICKKSVYRAINSLSIGILFAVFIGAFAIPDFNRFIGFRELARESMVLAEKHDIHDFHFFKFRSGENIDAYLQQEVSGLEIDEILSLSREKAFILFVRNKDLKTNKILCDYVNNLFIYQIEDYSIIIFNQNK